MDWSTAEVVLPDKHGEPFNAEEAVRQGIVNNHQNRNGNGDGDGETEPRPAVAQYCSRCSCSTHSARDAVSTGDSSDEALDGALCGRTLPICEDGVCHAAAR